jgi:VWFA-related protein
MLAPREARISRRDRRLRLALPALVLPLLAAPARETPPQPAFPAQATAITVDVVVLDHAGQPVRGLSRQDFRLLEDGREQPIVAFEEAAVAAAAATSPSSPALPAESPAVAGRSFALVLDDLGIGPLAFEALRPAVREWLARAAPGDEITLATTSGDVWWSDLAGSGAADLQTALGRVKGRRPGDRGGFESLSDWEAYRIATFDSEGAQQSAQLSRDGALPQSGREAPRMVRSFASAGVLDRVAQRWLDAGACPICDAPGCRDVLQECRPQVELRARQVCDEGRRRHVTLLSSLETLARGLASRPGRKAVMLLSESLLRDETIEAALRGVLEAAQQGLVAFYCVGVRGLAPQRGFAAELRGPMRPGDLGLVNVEDQQLSFAAAEQLAEETGGRLVTTSNNLGEGLERMALESSGYYLLGYQPEKPPDGGWHGLKVEVRRPGTTVRARRRYLAAPPAVAAAGPAGPRRRPAPALSAGVDRGALPLRVSAYVREPDEARGLARVVLAIELDGRAVQTEAVAGGSERSASVDLTVQAVPLARRPDPALVDQKLELTLGAADESGWWLALREIALAPGVAQVRVLVRDRRSGRIGLATRRLEVPAVSAPYLGTPILSDRLAPGRTGEPAPLAPLARRSFAAGKRLYCQYEVFNYAGERVPGLARLFAGHTLSGPGGTLVAQPTAIDTATNRAVRRIELPPGLAPGRYVLQVTVEDQLAQRTLAAREAFTIEP